jgi:hypothetical protein
MPPKNSDTKITSIDDEQIAIDEPTAAPIKITDHGDNFSGDKVELTIHSGEGKAGRQAVFIGINGHGLNVPRDIPVVVAQEVVDQLDNCTMTMYEALEGGVMAEREVKRFSTTVRPVKAKK